MKLMIVDDEVIIRSGLASVIDWEELGLTLLTPAESAEEALRRMPDERPDILMTDIRMHGKSGLQLAEAARQLFPDLEVLILSGYDDFAYAQQALRQQVGDYLLKTSRPEEIVRAVMQARQRIEERIGLRSRERSQTLSEQDRALERWVTLGEPPPLEEGALGRAALEARLCGEDGACSSPDALQVVLLSASGWDDTPRYRTLLLFAVGNVLGELQRCTVFAHERRLVAVMRLCSGTERPLDGLIGRIEQLLKCKLFAAAGSRVSEPDELPASYRAAQTAAAYRAWLPDKCVRYDEVARRSGGSTHATREEELELAEILLGDDLARLRRWTGAYMETRLADPEATADSLQSAYDAAVLSALRWLEQVLEATGRSGAQTEALARLRTASHAEAEAPVDACDRLLQRLHAVMKTYHQQLADGPTAYVRRAKAYIESHLGGDVGLQHVSAQVHLSPAHFSEVFKRETGVTFGDYVIGRKMRRAQEVLASSPLKVSEVAAEVGYEDVKYFGQLFKKHTGRTPSEYRESRSDPDSHER
ncbi:helix-turn-helix domain-containing protein [Paenibacillus sp. IB182496]|uniref:Helix-turn-helix domain-containing protein n=1 Tax=Paenibacillus sabuli TaxID=2772509 RepID=A0A927GUP1_9BACL|nr:helix-turn-helix domain-containing protein [Paenibacillus sabuli]MBD2848370.1 helix-turn-helix domain-containing protein [Paenibacillus sabuli]